MKTAPVMIHGASSPQPETMRQFYRVHAMIYDATRWTFLHGRGEVIQRLELPLLSEQTLLEVGCGTGHNLALLARQFAAMQLIGVDVSPHMLTRAASATKRFSSRVRLFEAPYAPGGFSLQEPVDAILFSYSLTMFNPGWETALDRVLTDLRPGGQVAVVDFHDTRSRLFRRWMDLNHVRMDGHLLPALQERFRTEYLSVRSGGIGLWQYFLFVGRKVQS